MSDINENIEEFDDEQENYITLTDDDGNEVSFEFMDSIDCDGHEYAVLLPFDDEEGDLVILEVIPDESDPELVSFVSVDDEDTLYKVFDIFKEKFKDEFDFKD
ncbi:MAG: DUF1292 domain-containing protein [Ruminococcus flavefaciens]|nr:DUF1292 domain-containing protein [Ruminococcus flavefaciens]MCM1229556.1 DUF1292 domain-containing protein [Ruminococcus flavefaciens]